MTTVGDATSGLRFEPMDAMTTSHSIMTVVTLSGVNNSTSMSTGADGNMMSSVNSSLLPTLTALVSPLTDKVKFTSAGSITL